MIDFSILMFLLLTQAGPQDPAGPPPSPRVEWAVAQQEFLTRMEKDRNHFDREWNKLDARLLKLEGQKYAIFWICLAICGITIASFLVLVIKVWCWAKTLINEQIGALVDKNRVVVKEMIQNADRDRAIRTGERILVIARQGREPVADYLRQSLKFRHVSLETIPEDAAWDDDLFADMAEDQYDLVVFDHLTESQINGFLDHSGKTSFVGYETGEERIKIQKQHRGKVNFANSLMTLYARILEAGRYRQTLAAA